MFEMTTGMLLSGLVIGGVGLWLCLHGKREREPATLLAGIGLSVLPMAAHTVLALWGLSAACVVALVAIRKLTPQGAPIA